MRVHNYQNHTHLGDCLWHSHFLRHLALNYLDREFRFYCQVAYHRDLKDVFEGVPNIRLLPYEQRDERCLDCWIGRDWYWDTHALHDDIALFLLRWFDLLAEDSGLKSPFNVREDLLFDFPALLRKPRGFEQDFDILIVNAQPHSGQFHWDVNGMKRLIERLGQKYRICLTNQQDGLGYACTQAAGLTVTQIGSISLDCAMVIGSVTGPMWPTFNRYNPNVLRALWLKDIAVNYGENFPTFATIPDIEHYLESIHFL